MNKKTLFIYSLVVLSFFVNSLTPIQADNDLKFNHITVIDGLLHNSATCIVQDPTGFIWIGTQRGLNRYDGYKLDSYLNETDLNSTLFHNRIRQIVVDGNYLWLGTYNGLECFDIKRKKFIKFNVENDFNLTKRKDIQTLFIDSKHRLWIGTPGGLECALISNNKAEPKLKKLKINNRFEFKLKGNVFPEVVELTNKTIFLLLDGKLLQTQTNNTIEIIKTKEIEPALTGIQKINSFKNNLWLFYENKAIAVRQNKNQLLKYDEFEYQNCNIVATQLNSNYIWISTNQGIAKVDVVPQKNRIQFYYHSVTDPNSVCSDHQSSIFLDNKNNLWVSTWSGGVSYANVGKQKFELVQYLAVNSNKYLPSEFVYSIHEDVKGDIYIGTKFGGISRFNTKNKAFDYTINLKEKLKINTVVPCIDSDNEWIYAAITFNGTSIYRINKVSKKIEMVKSYVPNTVFSFSFDSHQQLWVGVLGVGLSCLKINEGKVVSEKLYTTQSSPFLKLSSNDVNYVFNDKKKNEVLISTVNGLNRLMLNPKGEVSGIAYYLADAKNKKTLSSNYVWPIDKENDSIYWVGTMGSGLNRVVIGKRVTGKAVYKAERFGLKEGAPSNDIESVLVDKFGNVWCGGRYLSCFNYKRKKFKTYYEDNGLQSYLFGTGTSCKARNGMLFFGGLKGMNYFMPDTIVEKNKFKVVLSRIIIDGKSLIVGDTLNGRVVLKADLDYLNEVILPYPSNNIRIDFSSLSYARKKCIQYRYKLEGFDKEWVYTDGMNPYAMYAKLPYKSYKFTVQVGVDNQFDEVGRAILIEISPPWWLSIWAYIIYSILSLFIILIVSRYSLNWINMKRLLLLQNEREKQKEELLKLKMNFFTNISHEFKTPLTLINAAVYEIETKNEIKSGNRYFEVIKRNNSKLLHLISELMDFQRSNESLIELKTTQMDVCKFIEEIFEEFQPLSELSGISMKLTLPSKPVIAWVDEECLVKIFTNVLSNSLRYTEKGGEVDVKLSIGQIENYKAKFNSKIIFTEDMQAGNQLVFTIVDTGIGISTESLPEVFERFHTAGSKISKHLGSGVGLAFVKSLVKLHNGGLLLSSERNEGTEFVFTIPLNSEYISENQKIVDSQFDRQLYIDDYKVQLLQEDTQIVLTFDESKPTLLLVDDNKDILMVLCEHFKADYNILMAEDGEEALNICNDKYPDIIISDVMMPKITGLELCNTIKSQLKTCYIPIILLTARGTTEQQIEGLAEGADAYIPKPFHLGLLQTTVVNLLNKAKQANELLKSKNNDSLVLKNIRGEVLDKEKQQFIDKLKQIIEDNIDKSNFSIDNLCQEIGMGRSRLYAQMKNTTDETLGDFIREIRLQKAAELLRTTSLSVSEVSFKVGIESPSFFSRSFKERFGIPPSEYIKHLNN